MRAYNLTDYQLYVILQNPKLQDEIRKTAADEFNKRNLSLKVLKEISLKHEKHYPSCNNEKLDIKYKLLLIALPFLMLIHSIIVIKFIPLRHKRKMKEYWFYVCVGYLFWTIFAVLICKYILFRPIVE